MNIALVAPYCFRNSANPGHNMITAGIITLLKKTSPNIMFSYIDMMKPDPQGFEAARKTADLVVVCGNPRFNLTEETTYWDNELFIHLKALAKKGIRIIDGWAGSAYPLPIKPRSQMVADLLKIQKNQRMIDTLRSFSMVIARDQSTQDILDRSNVPVAYLPDCSFWARQYYTIFHEDKTINAIIVFRSDGNPQIVWSIQRIQQKLNEELPCYVICINNPDYKWYTDTAGRNSRIIKINSPAALLKTLATAKRVLSVRVHLSIPAVSVDCQVAHVSVDSRSLTLEPFKIPTFPLDELYNKDFFPKFGGHPIDPTGTEFNLVKILEKEKLLWNT
ncbi:hypothetical protein ES707_08083 [subsurface metagenome]